MTSASAPSLNKGRIHRLLAAVGSVTDDGATPEVTEYDWRDPHYLNEDQRNQLAAVMSQVAALIAEKLTHFFSREYAVTPVSITEHFAAKVPDLADLDRWHCLTFGSDTENPCGFVAVGPETACKWVTRLLGDSESNSDADRTLSPLEESLLGDLVCGMVETFLAPLRSHQEMRPSGQVTQGQPSIQFGLTEEVCKIAFEIKEGDSTESDEGFFLLPSRALAPLTGRTSPTASSASREEVSRIMTEHIYRMPVTVTAAFPATIFRFGELMEVGRDDVLLLDQPIDDSVELVIDGRGVFRGRPARSDGQYAVVVMELARTAPPGRWTLAASRKK